MSMLSLRCQPVLTVRAAVLEHMRWDAHNTPSTTREIADGIGRNLSSVRRAVQKLVQEGAMVQVGQTLSVRAGASSARFMLTSSGPGGARLLT